MRRALALLIPMLFLAVLGPLGCGDDDPVDPGAGTGPDWPDELALPTADEQTLDEALALLIGFQSDVGYTAARDSLLARLAGHAGVASAALEDDGSTITLVFTDGAGASIFTDEVAFGAWTEPDSEPRAPERVPAADKEAYSCADMVTPPNRSVHIVNLAGASNPETLEYTASLRQHLLDLGWTEDEIAISQRETFDDYGITPDTVFDQEGYGIVLFIAHGGFSCDAQGNEHFVMQCFRGGAYENGYQEHVSEERFEQYRTWFQDGRLSQGCAWCEADSAYMPHVNLRDDLLAEEMTLEEGAMVSFIGCNSIQLEDELASVGAGSVLGWDGSMHGSDGMDTWWRLLGALSVADGQSSAADILDRLHGVDLGYSTGHAGERTEMQLGGDDRDWYMPVSQELDATGECLPAGTDHVIVNVSFADCPERNVSVVVPVGTSVSTPFLPPTEADIELRAVDASGNTLDAGLFSHGLTAEAPLDLCPCEGGVTLDTSGVPDIWPYAPEILHVDVIYDDETLDDGSFDLDLPADELTGLVPGEAFLACTVLTATGETLGVVTRMAVSRCDAFPEIDVCAAWLSVTTGTVPQETERISVSSPGGLPESQYMYPGDTILICGYSESESVTLHAEALNSLGVSLGSTDVGLDLECGRTDVVLDFAVYGLVLEASPRWVEADGEETATLTATVRDYAEDDLGVPTGDPRAGVTVEFDTDLGAFVGASQGVSDANGEVTVSLASDTEGIARVHAFVTEDEVESPAACVAFGIPLSFQLNSREDPYPYADGVWTNIDVSCVDLNLFVNDATESCWSMHLTGNSSTTIGPLGYYSSIIRAGDVMHLVAEPLEGETCQADPEFLESGQQLWLHYWYGDDYDHQVSRLISDVANSPLTGTVTYDLSYDEIPYYAGSE